MGYDSFDGGSHSRHQWVAIDHERVPQWDKVDPERQAAANAHGNSLMPMRLADKFYVVRACQLCPEVWWQEYVVAEAVR